ncbi:HBL/NHE enterotoxin family protein [Salinarimonas sp.]|uniref:HBL/NHE enterotoxin family protein n=1 Tax=Salinarimonas sp. TaxID=2766526 RepID=UPI00391BD597
MPSTPAPRNDITGAATKLAGHETGSQIIQLNVLAKAVAEQPQFPTIDVDGLRDLNKHLATAQQHAQAWLNGYSGQCWNTLQGLISFGETFDNLYGSLAAAAKAMGDETEFKPGEIAKLVGALQALQTLVRQQQDTCQKTYETLTTYRTQVTQDESTFKTDYDTANRTLGGTSGEIAQLEQKIDAEQSALSKDLAMIGGGATMMVVGGLMIAVGALAEIETGGVSTALIVGGVAVIAGGATMTGIAGKNYDDTLKALRADQTQLAKDKAELTLLQHAKGQISGLTGTLDQTTAALANLVTAWQQLDNGIGAVVADLQNPQDYLASIRKSDPSATPQTVSIIVTAELETAQQDWSSAVDIASSLLEKGRNVQYVSTGNEAPTQAAIAAKVGKPQAFARAA